MIPYIMGAAAGMAVRGGHYLSEQFKNSMDAVNTWFTERQEDWDTAKENLGKAKDFVVGIPGSTVRGVTAVGARFGSDMIKVGKIMYGPAINYYKERIAEFNQAVKDAQKEFDVGRQEGLDGTTQEKMGKVVESTRTAMADAFGAKMPEGSVGTINPDMEDARDPEPIEPDGKADGKGTKLEELSGALDEGMADTAKAETKAAASVSKPEPEAPSAQQATVSAELE